MDDHAHAEKKAGAGVLVTTTTTTSVSVVNNKNHQPEFETDFKKWLAKQSLPIEAAINTITGAFEGVVTAVVLDFRFLAAFRYFGISDRSNLCPEKLSRIGGYKPLLVSFVAGETLEQARNLAVMMGVNAGVSRALKRLKGKEDVQTTMISGFGSGVMLSLVTGMRGPSVISVGVLFALVNGGLIKVEETLRNRRLSKERYHVMHSNMMISGYTP
ncbi:chloroplastic import inner membrane translocase subunit HP30-2-like [Rutidosis leptorrhynchoides]|uniref:chloroplastic import inner membrane translocase subunit HP30-2-like n=1 Tax=Rutidosis leptorrhynchoides TaxID=125765 RepID=UPI003A9A0C55